MTTTLKKIALTIIGICLYSFYFSQTPGEWTWMAGSNSNGDPVYGVKGVPDPANTPGDGYEAAKWTDNQGNLWLYGGIDFISLFPSSKNLWKFDVSTNMWTWMHGPGIMSPPYPSFGPPNVYSPAVLPGHAGYGEHAEWVDTNGNLWLFCSSPSITGLQGSMWKYDISLNQWAFVHGNIPPYSGVMGVPDPMNNTSIGECPISWVGDDGGLWMWCGPEGKVWKFDIASSMWTWMHGTTSPTDIIGTVGQYEPTNSPATGSCYQNWKSDDGTFYIFGPISQIPSNNIMWQFDPQINQWRVVHAGNLTNTAVFSSSGFNSLNCPSSTLEQRSCWKDECNRFYGIDQYNGGYIYCFDPAINQYALAEGSPSAAGVFFSPNYGTLGVSSPTIFPGSFEFEGSASWVDNSGNFWKFGYNWRDSISLGIIYSTSALWRYIPDLTVTGGISAVFKANPEQGCFPLEVDFLPQDTSSTITFQWNFGDPSTLSDTSSSPTPAYTYNSPGVYTVQLIMNGNSFCKTGTDTTEIIVTVLDTPIANLSASTINGCSPLDITFKNLSSNATSYQWDLGAGFIVVADTSSQFGTYTTPDTIYLIATNGFCDDTTSISIDCGVCGCTNPLAINYNPLAIIDDGSCIMPTPIIVAPNVFTPNSDAENNTFFIKTTFAKNTELTILNRWGTVVFEGSGLQPEWDGKNAVEGVYFYKYKVTGVLDDVYEGHGYVEMVK